MLEISAPQAVLIDKGIELSNQLHTYLSENSQGRSSKTGDYTENPTQCWNHKFLFLALLGYAASMAKFSELDREDFQQLAMGFYDYVLVKRGD